MAKKPTKSESGERVKRIAAQRIAHDGDIYEAGETVELALHEASELDALGALEPQAATATPGDAQE
jgi:hypothetical protein